MLKQLRALGLVYRGNKARAALDWARARDAYRGALSHGPRMKHIWVQYGHAAKESGDFEEAENAYRHALTIEDNNPDTHLQLGHLLKLTRRFDEAEEAYAAAVNLGPDLDDPHIEARKIAYEGDRVRDSGDWEGAKKLYKRALDTDPAMERYWVQFGHAAKESGSVREADRAYRRAIAINPENADTYLQLGHALRQLDRLDEAEQAYSDALARDKSLSSAAEALAAVVSEKKIQNRPKGLPPHLRMVIMGTIGICNASCMTCPTGKPETDHVPRVPMSMELFEKIIRSISDLGLSVTDQISFGLFGDGLVDPFVVQRAALARSLLPEAPIVVNTNGAAYNRKRHSKLRADISAVSIHVESLNPETYHKQMHPLRLDRVLPKLEQILEDFRGKVFVSVPVSRMNIRELPSIRKFFLDRGATSVVFDPISNRCGKDLEKFRSIALDPSPIRCPSEILNDLIVDCDGRVLVCCQDFSRVEPIGNLTDETLAEVLTNQRRRAVREIFDNGRHTEMATCANCYADLRGKMEHSIKPAGFEHQEV